MSDQAPKFYLRIVVEDEEGKTLLGDSAEFDTYEEAEKAWMAYEYLSPESVTEYLVKGEAVTP